MEINNKYNLGDTVYCVQDNEVYKGVIAWIKPLVSWSDYKHEAVRTMINYTVQVYPESRFSEKLFDKREEELFSSVDELISFMKENICG